MKILSISKKELISFFRDRSTFIILLIPIIIFPIYNTGMHYIGENNCKEIKICFCSDSEIANNIFNDFKKSDIGYDIQETKSNNREKLLKENRVDCIIEIKQMNVDFICNSQSYQSISKSLKVGEQFQQFFYSKICDPNHRYTFNLKNESHQSFNPSDNIMSIATPIMLIVFCFQSILGFSNDIFSGEKERNTLEILYLSNVSKKKIYCGKWLALAFISAINVMICVFTYIFSNTLPFFHIQNIIYLFVILLCLSWISVTVSSTVSLRAKSIKSAQTTNEFVLLIPIASAVMLSLGFADRNNLFIHFIPLVNIECDLSNIFSDNFNPLVFLCDLPINMIFIFIISFFNIKYMESEKIFR